MKCHDQSNCCAQGFVRARKRFIKGPSYLQDVPSMRWLLDPETSAESLQDSTVPSWGNVLNESPSNLVTTSTNYWTKQNVTDIKISQYITDTGGYNPMAKPDNNITRPVLSAMKYRTFLGWLHVPLPKVADLSDIGGPFPPKRTLCFTWFLHTFPTILNPNQSQVSELIWLCQLCSPCVL